MPASSSHHHSFLEQAARAIEPPTRLAGFISVLYLSRQQVRRCLAALPLHPDSALSWQRVQLSLPPCSFILALLFSQLRVRQCLQPDSRHHPGSTHELAAILIRLLDRLQLKLLECFVKVLLSRQQPVLLSLLPASTSHQESDLDPGSTCSERLARLAVFLR